MGEVSHKKRKFIEKNFKHLSIDELARRTGLRQKVIRSLIDEYSTKMPKKDHIAQVEKRAGISLTWRTIFLTLLLFAITTTVIYSPSINGDFVFDDSSIQENPLIHITRISQLADLLLSNETSRRIGLMSFALNYYFGGLNTFGYHLVNIIIHILNGLTLFLLSYTILTLPLGEGNGRGEVFKTAFLGSLVWLAHPIQTQAVSYIVQRLTSLSALFFLLSLLCYIKGRVDQAHRRLVLFILSLLSGLLALGTKQNAATLPFFIILSEFFFFQRQPLKMERGKLVLIMVCVGLFILISGIYLGSDFIPNMAQKYEMRGWTPLERLLTQLRVIIFYMSLLIYPHPSRLNLDHDFAVSHSLFSPFTTFLSLLALVSMLGLAISIMKRRRLISFALLWFLGNLVIESSIIPLELVFEHRLYLPSMGLIMVVLGLCVRLPKREWEKWITALIIPFILLFSYWTYERASVWRGPLSLWTDAVKKSPDKARPHNNLGYTYFTEGRLDETFTELELALTLKPDYPEAHINLAIAFIEKGMLDEAITECKKALAINPNDAKAYTNLGAAYSRKGMVDEAITVCEKALAIKPGYAEAYNNLGFACRKKGMLDEAISHYKRALIINPDYLDAHNNLGVVYARRGSFDEAINHYLKALDINPHHPLTHYNLGVAYGQKGRLDEAISHYKEALTVNPRYADAHNNLGSIYDKQGRIDEAIFHYKEALAINTRHLDAHTNLGVAYARMGKFDEAIKEYQEALVINPHHPLAHYNLGVVYREKGRLEEAIMESKKALAIKPTFAQAYNNLGLTYVERGRLEEAISEYEKALAINPTLANVHKNLSVAYYYQGNYKSAIIHCDKAVSLGYSVDPALQELLKPYR